MDGNEVLGVSHTSDFSRSYLSLILSFQWYPLVHCRSSGLVKNARTWHFWLGGETRLYFYLMSLIQRKIEIPIQTMPIDWVPNLHTKNKDSIWKFWLTWNVSNTSAGEFASMTVTLLMACVEVQIQTCEDLSFSSSSSASLTSRRPSLSSLSSFSTGSSSTVEEASSVPSGLGSADLAFSSDEAAAAASPGNRPPLRLTPAAHQIWAQDRAWLDFNEETVGQRVQMRTAVMHCWSHRFIDSLKIPTLSTIRLILCK